MARLPTNPTYEQLMAHHAQTLNAFKNKEISRDDLTAVTNSLAVFYQGMKLATLERTKRALLCDFDEQLGDSARKVGPRAHFLRNFLPYR
jgi:hypothetical protein